ncbi:hypothetical protein PhCBS80983_g00714 [Powellomyces hirtus]|uniref:Protein PET100, mitochondrial n=1 Tax=Powellomyces hirtus TaxID=109895 RepID=A0A507ED52_9FUNG|nr:hypothetical protein PhCBS80983_g00714 [Powellomyces hirtus]
MPLPKNFVRAETLKFGIYILFPIGVLYLFNRPDLQEKLGRDQIETLAAFRVPEDKLFKLPSSMSEVREETARIRKLRHEQLEKQKAENSSA